MNKIIVFIAMSLDGYIARADHDISFLDMVNRPGEDYGYAEMIAGVDTVVMGRKTYEKVLAMGHHPHPDKPTYVISRTEKQNQGNVIFYNGELRKLLASLVETGKGNILIDGGAEIISELTALDMIDEYTISIIPILLGGGIRLFEGKWDPQTLVLDKSESFSSGLLQLKYNRN